MVVTDENASPASPSLLGRFRALFLEAAQRFRVRRETGPVDTAEALFRFTATRAAFVGQKKLYGYLKARMGTRYPSMFEDDVFVASIDIAKWHIFAACLSDITIHTVARVAAEGGLSAEEGRSLASGCYEAGLQQQRAGAADEAASAAWRAAFRERLSAAHWENLAAGGDALTESPKALYRWAPIDDALKRHDREIVENSIRFAWAEVTRDFRKRGMPAAIAADFRSAREISEGRPSR